MSDENETGLPPYQGGPLHNPGTPGRSLLAYNGNTGSEVVFVPSSTFPTEQDLRQFVKRCVREELDNLARELRTRTAFQPGTWQTPAKEHDNG